MLLFVALGFRRSWSVCVPALLVAATLAVASCASTTDSLSTTSGAGGHTNVDAGGGAGANGAIADRIIYPKLVGPIAPPGVYLTSDSAVASSASPCAATTLGDVLGAIRAAEPTLADIKTIYNPATATSDGSFIYAYDVGALGFDIVFKRGLGDCPAGCTENDYQYFTTGAACRPTKIGHYHAAWGTGTCLTVEGSALWTHPTPPDPLTVCGADNSPRDLRGTYGVNAVGQHTPCAIGAAASPIQGVVQFVVEQDASDLSTGFVTFAATGDPLVDGVRIPARFQRSRFDAVLMADAASASCPRAISVTARYDLEGFEPGGIDALGVGGETCATCKSSLSVTLGVGADAP